MWLSGHERIVTADSSSAGCSKCIRWAPSASEEADSHFGCSCSERNATKRRSQVGREAVLVRCGRSWAGHVGAKMQGSTDASFRQFRAIIVVVVVMVVKGSSLVISQTSQSIQQSRTVIALVGRSMLQRLAVLQHIRAIIHLFVPASTTSVAPIHFFVMLLLLDVIVGFLQFHVVRIVVRRNLRRLLMRMTR